MNNGYFSAIHNLLTEVNKKNKLALQKSASILAVCFESDGILHVFGCGHSYMIAEEMFYRAGKIVPETSFNRGCYCIKVLFAPQKKKGIRALPIPSYPFSLFNQTMPYWSHRHPDIVPFR